MSFLLALLIEITRMQTTPAPPRVIEISAKRFEFKPTEVHLRVGETVTIREIALDRPHGMLIKPLHVDLDASPDEPDQVTITPTVPGRYPAICDHYCGMGHGNMKMTFIVE